MGERFTRRKALFRFQIATNDQEDPMRRRLHEEINHLVAPWAVCRVI